MRTKDLFGQNGMGQFDVIGQPPYEIENLVAVRTFVALVVMIHPDMAEQNPDFVGRWQRTDRTDYEPVVISNTMFLGEMYVK